jgi:hypothetical protein
MKPANANAATSLPSDDELDEMGDNELNDLCDLIREAWEANPDDPVSRSNFERLRLYVDRRANEDPA